MKRYSLLLINAVVFFCGFGLLAQTSRADCSCQIGSNQIYIIGYEYKATSCPQDGASYTNTSGSNYYLMDMIICQSGKITRYASYGDALNSPGTLIAYHSSQGAKILTNPTGTHIIVVMKTSYSFNGVIAGKSVSEIVSTTPYVNESLNQYCNYTGSLVDTDADGFIDCLDCAKNDPQVATDCPTCDAARTALVKQCGGEDKIAGFDDVSCTGHCKTFGPPPCSVFPNP